MLYQKTTATKKIMSLTARIRGVPGGTSASKTVSILLYLIALAQSDKIPTLTSVVSESFPHLRRGAMRDFLMILKSHDYFKDDRWNKTESTYTFETGSQIEFFSVDQPDKVRGARRERLFVNEANNIPYSAFEELEVRTKEFIFLDWNPTSSFWWYEEVMNKRNDAEQLILTYKDNEALSRQIIDSIEQRKGRKGWWQVYGLGQLGEVEGKIYKDWQIVDEIPHEARLERRGLDFGFSVDFTAIVDIYYYNGGYIVDEICFQKGLSNRQIADILQVNAEILTIADSAEPKSIDEIRSYGINIIGAQKGKDSVAHGIQTVQDQRISMTKRSVNIIKEYRNYLWTTDKNGKILNEPEHQWSHCFAPETLVYTTKGKKRIDELVGKEGYLYSRNGRIERFFDVKPTRKNTETISLTFDDGNTLTITPDHLLLQPNGKWIEASLLMVEDKIQSGIYEQLPQNDLNEKFCIRKPKIYWNYFLSLSWCKIFQRICKWEKIFTASLCLGTGTRENSVQTSHSSYRQQSSEQRYIKFNVFTWIRTFVQIYKARSENCCQKKNVRKCSSIRKEMAWVKRGQGMAQVTWQENMGKKKTFKERMCSLPFRIYNSKIFQCAILSFKLQNESENKTITRIVRGFRSITYNLEVDNTHCLLVNGVIAHNSMDALRYGLAYLSSALAKEKEKQYDYAVNSYLDKLKGTGQEKVWSDTYYDKYFQ
jgi:phage terminase large subunit